MGLVKKEPSLASLLPTAPSRNQRRTSFGLSRKQFKTRRVIFILRIAENMKLIKKAIISSYLIFINFFEIKCKNGIDYLHLFLWMPASFVLFVMNFPTFFLSIPLPKTCLVTSSLDKKYYRWLWRLPPFLFGLMAVCG